MLLCPYLLALVRNAKLITGRRAIDQRPIQNDVLISGRSNLRKSDQFERARLNENAQLRLQTTN